MSEPNNDGVENVRRELEELQARLEAMSRRADEEDARRRRIQSAIDALPRPHVLIYNEKVKLGATLLNTLAAGSAVAGVFTPITAYVSGAPVNGFAVLGLIVIWIVIAAALHSFAKAMLDKLKPQVEVEDAE